MPKYLGDVRCWVNSGKHLLALSFSAFDPDIGAFPVNAALNGGQPLSGPIFLAKRSPKPRANTIIQDSSPRAGGKAGQFCEDTGEMALVGEAAGQRHIRKRQPAVTQQTLILLHPDGPRPNLVSPSLLPDVHLFIGRRT